MKKRRKKKVWPVILIIVIVAAAAAIIFASWKAGKISLPFVGAYQGAAQKDTAQISSLEKADAQIGSIKVTTQGSGSVEAASSRAVTLDYDGKLEKITVEQGDMVSAGDVLAVYDFDSIDDAVDLKKKELSEIDQQIAQTDKSGSENITAPVYGRVKRIYAEEDDIASDVTEQFGGVAELSADGRMKVEIETLRTDLKEGEVVHLKFDDKNVDGTIWKIEQNEDGNSRKLKITFPDDSAYRADAIATVRDDDNEEIGKGEIKSNSPYLVRAEYGVIDSVEVTLDSTVEKGNTLFKRRIAGYNSVYTELLKKRGEILDELKELESYRDDPVVTADADGYVESIEAVEGMTYQKGQQVLTIADGSSMNLKVDIDELDIDGVRVGQKAEVSFDAFADEIYDGTVQKISGVGVMAGGVTTYAVTISLQDSSRLRDGMSATATITLDEKKDVLLIPSDAVEMSGAEYYVEIISGDQIEKRPVVIGLVNEDDTEIVSGLAEGDTVVVRTRNSVDIMQKMMQRTEQMRSSSNGAQTGSASASGGNE